jgi:transposase
MPARFVNIDRDTPLLLAPNLREWVPDNHLCHFIVDAVTELDLRQVKVNQRGCGSEQYPPSMLMALIIYSYASGVFGSRRIEQATFDNVPTRLTCADTHPDHDTICTFRRENKALVNEAFVKVLAMAQELKFLKVGQITVAVDGTKVMANASKHSAVSYERAGQRIEQLEMEVAQLMAKAEAADSTPLEEGLTIPEEVTRRQERKAQLARARTQIQARAKARALKEQAAYEEKLSQRQERQAEGRKVTGPVPQPPKSQPGPNDQYNFTDPESRIMKAGNGDHFEQAYNAQAAVEVESRLIVGQRVSDAANDKEQLVPTVAAIPEGMGSVAAVLTDSGFYSQAAVKEVESVEGGEGSGTKVYAAVEKTSHHRTVQDLEKKPEPEAPAPEAPVAEVMKHRLRTREGKAKYKLRQQTVEPVFGIIKSVMGFRRFLLRGLEKVSIEWTWVSLAYNLKRMHRMQGAG